MPEYAAGALQGGGMGLKEYGDSALKKKYLNETDEKDFGRQKELLDIKHGYDLELERNRKVGGNSIDLSDLIALQGHMAGLEDEDDSSFDLPDLTEADFEDAGDDDKTNFIGKFYENNPGLIRLSDSDQKAISDAAWQRAKSGFSIGILNDTYTMPQNRSIKIPGQKGLYPKGTSKKVTIQNGKLVVTPTALPTQQPNPGSQVSGKIRVKLSNGQTGSIDAGEFDPKTMTKL